MKSVAKVLAGAILFFVCVTGADAGSGTQRLLVPNDNVGTEFGRDVAISGQTVLVGESSGGTGYIYEPENRTWVQKAALSAHEAFHTRKVALSGRFAILASEDRLYVFEKPVSGWTDTDEASVLIPEDFNPENNRITDVNIHENTLVVGTGAGKTDIGKRQFYIFEFNGTYWMQSATVSGDNIPGFGVFADVFDNRIIAMGSAGSSEQLAGFYEDTFLIYKKEDSGVWNQEAALTVTLNYAIKDVAITDGYAIAGGAGSTAYVFKHEGNQWFLSQELSEKDEREKYGYFGWDVDITPEHAVISYLTYSTTGIPLCGAVFLYKNKEGSFVKTDVYTAENPQIVGFFGFSAGIAEDFFVAGHINDHQDGRNGSAVVVNLYLPGDIDRDGCVGKNDAAILRTFLNRPLIECPECDLNEDGKITILDARKLVTLCTNADCECP